MTESIEIFKGNDGIVALYDGIIHEVGFLDLNNNEKTYLEKCLTSNTHAIFMVNSEDIVPAVDIINLNRLTKENIDIQCIQIAMQTSLVKYNKGYYFVHDLLAKDLRRFAIQYGKSAADIAFIFPKNQIILSGLSLKLVHDAQRRSRKFDICFGPFESYAPNRVDDKFIRFLANTTCEFIEIENHLVNDIKLETALNKIDMKASFTPIPTAPLTSTQECTDTPPSKKPSYVAKTNEASYHHVMSASSSIPSTSTDIQPSKKPNKMYFGLNLTPLREAIVSERIQHTVSGIDTDKTEEEQQKL